MNRSEYYRWLGDIALVAVCVIVALWIFSSKAEAYELSKRWEKIYFLPGTTVQFNFYDEHCNNDRTIAIENIIISTASELSRADKDRNYTYLGRTTVPGWNENVDGIITIDCATNSQMPSGLNGVASPVDNCATNNHPTDPSLCGNGDTRILLEGVIRIRSTVPLHRIPVTAKHEIGHVLTLGHSTTPGATMTTNMFYTAKSSQFQKTFSRDDWCALNEKFTMTEWPLVQPTVDDQMWIHMPQIFWLGVPWELVMIQDPPGVWTPAGNAAPVRTCESLRN